jgi:tetratricopeptide (TPR) repeat protein
MSVNRESSPVKRSIPILWACEVGAGRAFCNFRVLLVGILAGALAVACASTKSPLHVPTRWGQQPISQEMLLSNSPLATSAESTTVIPVENILRLTPEMISYLDRNVDRNASATNRTRQLTDAILSSSRFELAYDELTRTADQTFEDRRGNCLSFTNLYIAMARNLGLDANYQEVDIPPYWSLTGEFLLLSKHVNVYIRTHQDKDSVVDFNFYDLSTKVEPNIISDQRAQALFYSNIGVERMLSGDTPAAFANFVASLQRDSTFSPAWVNLGILYRREGFPEYAEAAYFAALDDEPENVVAMSNLTSLYAEVGDMDLAEEYRQKVIKHRMQNPYYRYFLAKDAFENGDYEKAIKHLKYAIKKSEEESRFYSLLGLSYLMSGDREEAQLWMAKAESAASSQQERQVYSQKLRLLMQNATQD